jgi:dimeric dUTPase (all-alpha-NTP-PPase superfamily)
MVLSLKILKNLQTEQKKLDEFIREKYLQRNDTISHNKNESFLRVKVALLVEIGEFANELKTFKH